MTVCAFVAPLALVALLLSGCGGGGPTSTAKPTGRPPVTPFPHAPTPAPGAPTTAAPPTIPASTSSHSTTTTSRWPTVPGGPGGFISVSESVLNRGADDIATSIASELREMVVAGHKTAFIDFEDIRFEELAIGSTKVDVIANEGVQVSLLDMSNRIAHTPFCAHSLLHLVRCCGEAWGTASGQSYRAMNTLVLDEASGMGKLVTTTPPGGFTMGDVQIHHKMNGTICELTADMLHVVNEAMIGFLSTELERHLPDIVAKVVDVPANLVLKLLEDPPALGFGDEKFKLDNSFVEVDYNDHRINHYNKAEFKSTRNPRESAQEPPVLTVKADRDIAIGFSDFVMNTLFEALYLEHMFESEVALPFFHTPENFTLCSDCPVVVNITFKNRGEALFIGGRAANIIRDMTLGVGVRVHPSEPAVPIVSLLVNVTAAMAFELRKPDGHKPELKATLALEKFDQKVEASFVEIDLHELSEGVRELLNDLLGKMNDAIPALPIPPINGWTLDNPSFVVEDHQLVVLADVVKEGSVSQIVV